MVKTFKTFLAVLYIKSEHKLRDKSSIMMMVWTLKITKNRTKFKHKIPVGPY